MSLDDFKNKKVVILGFGREGQDTFKFLRKLFPTKRIGVADVRYKIQDTRYKIQNIRWHLGKNYLKALKNYDVIIKSPGIPFKILPKSALGKIITQTDIFFDNCPGKIIGITGTKGKSTTASMIYQVLKAGGIKVHLVGNIGKPVLSSLLKAKAEDVFVYELSSHQLYNLKKSPQIAVFLNIYPEHLDYYRNFKEYTNAKANISRYQTPNNYLVYNSRDKIIKEIARKSPAKKIPIKGKYYELNKEASRAVGRIFKIPAQTIERTIKNFKYLPHRLELVGTFKGITFYNDALATIPEATIAAINALEDRVETIMLGGFDRNIDFKKLAKRVLQSKIKNIIFFPTTGEKIWKSIVRQNMKKKTFNHFFVNRAKRTSFSSSPSPPYSGAQYMRDAVKLAYQYTKKGKICLLSTASASFSIFKDYKEKGELFKRYAREYGHSKKIQ